MERRPPAISPGKYVFWSFLTVFLLILLFFMISSLGIIGTAVIFGLALILYGKVKYGALLKAWEAGKIPLSTRWPRATHNIPYYQPAQHSYQQGYQQQSSRQRATSSAAPKEDHPSAYEQPQAHYPEQPPPMI